MCIQVHLYHVPPVQTIIGHFVKPWKQYVRINFLCDFSYYGFYMIT